MSSSPQMSLRICGVKDMETVNSCEEAVITFADVAMEFDGLRVLEKINLEIPRGQTLVVIGESGCGKTVLLKLMIGLLRPTQGKVTFDGKVLTDLGDAELTRQRLRFGFL